MGFLMNPVFLKVLMAVGIGATALGKALSAPTGIDAMTLTQLGAAVSTIAALFHAAPGKPAGK